MFVHNGRYYLQNEDLKVNQTYLFKNRKVIFLKLKTLKRKIRDWEVENGFKVIETEVPIFKYIEEEKYGIKEMWLKLDDIKIQQNQGLKNYIQLTEEEMININLILKKEESKELKYLFDFEDDFSFEITINNEGLFCDLLNLNGEILNEKILKELTFNTILKLKDGNKEYEIGFKEI